MKGREAMDGQAQEKLGEACQAVADLAAAAGAWVSDPANGDLVGAEAKSLVHEIGRAGRRARRLARAARSRMSVSVFGPSQAGKSFLVSVLARPGTAPLTADYPGPGGQLDYIREINPEGEGESTGLVTRFTMERYAAPDGYPVKLTLLSESDLARVLISAGILIVLAAALTAIGGVLKLRWLTQDIADDPLTTVTRALALRDAKSRSLGVAMILFGIGFACYCAAIAQLLMHPR